MRENVVITSTSRRIFKWLQTARRTIFSGWHAITSNQTIVNVFRIRVESIFCVCVCVSRFFFLSLSWFLSLFVTRHWFYSMLVYFAIFSVFLFVMYFFHSFKRILECRKRFRCFNWTEFKVYELSAVYQFIRMSAPLRSMYLHW